MELKTRTGLSRLAKALFSLLFGVFFTGKAVGQLLAPSITVSPSSTNVQNGDTVTFTVVEHCTVGLLSSDSCSFNNGALPTNAVFIAISGLLDLNSTITNTLTVSHITSACAGTYTVTCSDVLALLTGTSTASVNLGVIPTVVAVPGGSQMIEKGFKIQFSAPTGSNLVIQASSDMKNWTSVYTNIVKGGSLTYTDLVAKTVSGRFYRARFK